MTFWASMDQGVFFWASMDPGDFLGEQGSVVMQPSVKLSISRHMCNIKKCV